MKPDTLRNNVDPFSPAHDLEGMVIGLAVWLVILVAAPLIVLVLAVGLLSVELPIVLALAAVLLVVRFTGLLPWQVVVVDEITGAERRESHRNLWRAARRVRAVNTDRRVKVRWAWA